MKITNRSLQNTTQKYEFGIPGIATSSLHILGLNNLTFAP
jgi:hypothetical protein